MDKLIFNPGSVAAPTGYSHVATVSGGTTIYIAGQVSLSADGTVIGRGDFRAQAARSFENLRIVLAAAGATPSDVVSTNMYVVDISPSKLADLRAVRADFYGAGMPPTNTLLGVAALALDDLLFEVDAIAVID